MGWKTSMILVDSEETFDVHKLLNSLGCFEIKKIEEQTFDSIMNPEDDVVYIGKFNGNTIFCMQDIPMDSIKEGLSAAEKTLAEAFKNSEVVSLVLHSVANLWGYSVVKNGKKIRVRAGSSEGGTMVEFGEVLKQEKQLLSQSKINAKGERVFVLEDMPSEEFTEDQVGENFVFDVSEKYFDDAIDSSEELLETKFVGYSFSKTNPAFNSAIQTISEPESIVEEVATIEKVVIKKPWWKFW